MNLFKKKKNLTPAPAKISGRMGELSDDELEEAAGGGLGDLGDSYDYNDKLCGRLVRLKSETFPGATQAADKIGRIIAVHTSDYLTVSSVRYLVRFDDGSEEEYGMENLDLLPEGSRDPTAFGGSDVGVRV